MTAYFYKQTIDLGVQISNRFFSLTAITLWSICLIHVLSYHQILNDFV